jgi:hypothetical protein
MDVRLGVVGAHLRGQPLNPQLLDLGAVFVQQTWTTPQYRLFVPGMIRSEDGGSIEIEVWTHLKLRAGAAGAHIWLPSSLRLRAQDAEPAGAEIYFRAPIDSLASIALEFNRDERR